MFKGFVSATAVSLAMAVPAWSAPPPATVFGRIPAVLDAEISPNGQHVAILGAAGGQRAVSIATVDQPGLPSVSLGEVEGLGLRWVGDDYVLARVAAWKSLGVRDAYRFERNVAIDLQARQASILLGSDPNSVWLLDQPVTAVIGRPPRAVVRGLALSGGPSTGINTKLERKGVDNPFIAALFSVDPASGRGTLIDRGNYDTAAWEVDETGQSRVRLDIDEINHRFSVMARPKGVSHYERVWGGDYEARRAYYGYASAEDAIYIGQNDRLARLTLANGHIEPLGPDLAHDSASLIWDEARGVPVGIASGAAGTTMQWLDPELGGVHTTLSRLFKGQHVTLVNWSSDRNRYVVSVTAQQSPRVWYLFDRAHKQLSPLGEEYPELKGVALGQTRWISYKARDGLEMGAYLTLPPGAAPGAKSPLIVLPHGGPAARDDDDFDFITQYLATRGYAVLRPQFRGSWGFGAAFETAGRGEWGAKMQTDLLDGVAAAAASGDVDPARACIVGASYGGYSALIGAALHSDSYRCAASVAGISNLGLLLVEAGRAYGRDSASLGELRADLGRASVKQLDAASPVKQVAGVNIPVLLIHGDKDTVVPLEQSTLMADALKAAGKPVELIVLANENHYLSREQTRIQTLDALGAFLARNLPVTP